jgi:hypothetical protein
MERKLWDRLYTAVMTTRHPAPPKGVSHSDRWVVLVHLWAAVHERPTAWACRREHWPAGAAPARLPSRSAMSRRLRTAAVGRLLNALLARYRGDPRAGWVRYVDSKPLPVGNYSKDPDARTGYGAGGYFRGYKLHAVWGAAPVPLAWEVRPAHQGDPVAARLLVPRLGGQGYLVGDAAYDSNPLYDAAGARGHQLGAPPQKPGRGLGHRPHSPFRLRARDLLAGPFGRALYRSRPDAERRFGNLCAFAGGLAPLPAWVRRLRRVKRWVQAKLLINAARILRGQPLAP